MACGDPGGAKRAGTQTASDAGVMTLSESFLEPLVPGDQKASGQSSSMAPPVQALRGLPCLGSLSVVLQIRHIEGPPGWGPTLVQWGPSLLFCRSHRGAPWLGSYSVVQCLRHLMGQTLYCSAADAGMWGERGHGAGFTPFV